MKKLFMKKELLSYLFLSILIVYTLEHLYRLDFKDLIYPLIDIYAPGDGRLTLAVLFKTIITGEWSLFGVPTSEHLSAPFSMQMYDFPFPIFAQMLYIKFLSIFSNDTTIVFNSYILSTYFLNAFFMYFILRKFRVKYLIALSIAYLFTFLGFHFGRIPHTFYTGYFFIPLWVYYLLLLQNKKALFFSKQIDNSYRFDFSKKNIFIIIVLLFSSTWNFYYTFFFAGMIIFIIVSNLIIKRGKYHLYSGILLFSLVVSPFIVNMIPYKMYEIENGKNTSVAQRNPMDAENLGLKITTLLFPINTHRSETLAEFKEEYTNKSVVHNENNAATLGFIGALGFLSLIGISFYIKNRNSVLKKLANLNIFTLLLSMVGGFGVVVSYLITAQIRGYNRISVFIAAFAFIALAIIVNRILKKYDFKNIGTIIIFLFFIVFGAWDLTGRIISLKTNQEYKAEYISDKKFVSDIEKYLDKNKSKKYMIAQYPYLSYPEGPIINKVGNYEHFNGYLHSQNIYWSFGAVRGRESANWWENLIKLPMAEQLKRLEKIGFSGIVLNKDGYKDNGAYQIQLLEDLTKFKPLVSDDNKLVFFKLNPIVKPEPIFLFKNFYPWEGEEGKFRWASDNAKIIVENVRDKEFEIKIEFFISSLIDRDIKLKLNDEFILEKDIKKGEKVHFSKKIKLGTGKNTLSFISSKDSIVPSGADNRKLLFGISEFNAFIIE